jgi:LacI family transcriptional regulator
MDRTRRPKLADVAALAGVSVATASRAISRPELVNPQTLEAVEAAAREVGYLHGGAARALASGRTMLVGAVFPTLDHAIFARAIHGLQARLRSASYQLVVAAHEYVPAAEAAAVRTMLAHGVDALVVVGADRLEETSALLRATSVPVVVAWSFDQELPSIGFDNEAAGALVADHLADLGHTRFGVISGALRANDRARLRLAGAKAALARRGLSLPSSRVIEQPFTLAGGRAGLRHLLSAFEPATAIICGNDLLASGAMLEALSSGMRVPADISIAGIDDLEIASHLAPALTTVHLPTEELGEEVAGALLSMLRGGSGPSRVELPIELVVRASTGRPDR